MKYDSTGVSPWTPTHAVKGSPYREEGVHNCTNISFLYENISEFGRNLLYSITSKIDCEVAGLVWYDL